MRGALPRERDHHNTRQIMPEFEEPETESSSKENYTPSIDASDKPRTRRRSGGFKTTPATTSIGIGEVDPAEAVKREKLSGGSKPGPKPKKEKREKSAPKADKPAAKPEKSTSRPSSKAQPSADTLAAIQRVDARLAERKNERDARRGEREKNRPAKSGKKPLSKKNRPSGRSQSGGLIGSILSFFGLGPKQAAKKQGGRPSGNRERNGRPPGKGGNRSQGQHRRRSGKSRRSGVKGARRSTEHKS